MVTQGSIIKINFCPQVGCETAGYRPAVQLVEKPAVTIKPEQVFCMKSKRTEKKEEDFLSILLVCGDPTLDG